ncbi:NirD/YgiW/YdeI family stress tolerance protein [Silvanigrella paludirubra]|uniref:NirD/YgiW/YdeI family stress tolerance protein n=1 Tax=Silvanigrella paludirubra TaxID=2499159 RepID=A0A6N6VVR8_9BACT|nr:NirD/YgiW/YdeI family stress tolerance protein [Silvanigrella paludirubra]KAB8039954.1 NirD/YgiW/YdeI family stress tolerance protein [Silvanigrella paludirubra]
MKTINKFFSVLLVSFSSSTANAGFVDDTIQDKAISIKEAMSMPNDSFVILEGYILSKLTNSSDKYLFTDKKSKENICLKIDEFDDGKKIMPDKPFDKNQKIRIRGEIDKSYLDIGKCNRFKIDVKEPIELL